MIKFNFDETHMDVLRTLSEGKRLVWRPFSVIYSNCQFYCMDDGARDAPVKTVRELEQWGYVVLHTDYEKEETTAYLSDLGRDALKYGAGGVA